jgi:hypothetical protein
MEGNQNFYPSPRFRIRIYGRLNLVGQILAGTGQRLGKGKRPNSRISREGVHRCPNTALARNGERAATPAG